MAVVASGVIESLGAAVRYSAIDEVPELIITVVDGDLWRDFTTKMHNRVTPRSFEEFVTTEPLDGLGTTVETLQRLCAGNTAALNAIDQATQRSVGTNQHSEGASNTHTQRPATDTRAQALRKLRTDRPDLHEQVLADELSPHAAMVQAGFRHRTFTVRADDPEHIARTLQRRLDPDALTELRRLLEDT